MLAQIDSPTPFDRIVISKVLDHLENPKNALERLRSVISPKGRLFVKMPVNSPASDHIFLLTHPHEVIDLVTAAGFEKAIKISAAISCVVIATPR